jgi:hypothetical protein
VAVIAGGCVPSEPLIILTSGLPNGAVGIDYSQQLAADTEEGAVWAVISGELPPGLELDSRSGAIGGTPIEPGTYQFTVQATDAASIFRQGEATYSITIHPLLQISAALDTGRVQEAYNETVAAVGGVPPYTFSAIGLPAGIGLDPATGAISGTPIYPVTGELLRFTVTDSGTPRQVASVSTPLIIKGLPVRIVTETLADVTVGSTGYSQQLQAAEGVPPYKWAVVAGDLKPLGLELVLNTGELRNRRNAAGQPIAIPADAAPSTFTIRVTDSDDPPSTATREFTVGVE